MEDFEEDANPRNFEKNWGIEDGLGSAFHALRDYEKAIDHYDKAIDHCPTNIDFLTHRAQCYYDQGMYDLSIKDLLKGLEEEAEDPQLLYRIGLSYYADS